MTPRFTAIAPALLAFAVAAPASAEFMIDRADTEAEIVQFATRGDLAVRLAFRASLSEFPPDPVSPDVTIGWGEVGGIEPTPFLVVIPGECWVTNGSIHVEDWKDCGVMMDYSPDGRTVIPLSIVDFEAKIALPRDGTANLRLEALFTDGNHETGILGALASSPVEIMAGASSAIAPLAEIQARFGVEPTPF